MREGANAWIFQGNPKIYDIAASIRELPETTWVVRRHRQEIHTGDKVYLWQSGADAGILGTATVLTEPEVMGTDTSKDRFYLKAEEFSQPEPRVNLRIDSVLEAPLTKSEILEDPRLRNLLIIRAPTGTNFPVTIDERAALDELIEQRGDGLEPKWREAIRLCRAILADRPYFESQEITYKHKIAENVRAAVAMLEGDDPARAAIGRAIKSPNNLVYSVDRARVLEWAKDNDEAARRAIRALAEDGRGAAERIDAFLAEVPADTLDSPGAKMGFAAIFLMGLDPATYPVYQPGSIKGAEEILGWEPVRQGASLGEEYEHHRAFVAHFRDRLRAAGLDVRDMLDAQSLIWWLMKYDQPEYRAWRGAADPPPPPTPPPTPDGGSLGELAEDLYVDEGFLREVVALLEAKRQLIFYGPPGTGKTYIARRLARFLAGGEPDRVEVVQFHPSYSYEDFVQGYRPRVGADGAMTYELVDGPLVRLARRARDEPDARHILLVDEINRGNLPRIFGELLYLLEYRDDEIALMYGGGERFALPENLWVLGTMNTADRSIGLIDAALRRRFHFKALFPGRPPLVGLLGRWLDDKAPAMAEVAAHVETLNARLRDRFGEHLQVGHSYFMVDGLDDTALERIWEVDILPFLEDQLFGKENELAQFQLTSIKRDASVHGLEESPDPVADADNQPDRVRNEG